MCDLSSRVQKFQSDALPGKAARFAELAKGQSPKVLFITCSDSRIDPALLLQSEPGEVFVVRNAGNIVPHADRDTGGESATLEFAIKGLGIPEIVVCGHSFCGAMAATLNPESASSLPRIQEWIEHAKPALKAGDDLDSLIGNNVLLQLENLRSYDFVREAEQAGRLTLHGWVYRFESGSVLSFDGERFTPIGDQHKPVG